MNKLTPCLIVIATLFFIGCTSIEIKEEQFLRSQSEAIVYDLIRFGASSSEQIAQRTAYSVTEIEQKLAKLQQQGQLQYDAGQWSLTQAYQAKRQDYIAAIREFNPEDLSRKSASHTFMLEQIAGSNIHYAAMLSKTPRETIILFPGNGFNLIPDAIELQKLAAPQRNLVIMEYPGMGSRGSKLSIESLAAHAEAFYSEVTKRPEVRDTKITVYGFSLGGFVATKIAAKYQPHGLILDSTAPDFQRWIDSNVPLYAKAFVDVKAQASLTNVSNQRLIQQLRQPILFMVGGKDTVTPTALMQALAEQAKASRYKKFVVLDGVGHGESLDHPDFNNTVSRFLNRLLSEQAQLNH